MHIRSRGRCNQECLTRHVLRHKRVLAEQIWESKGFVERAEKRLLKLVADRVARIVSLEQGRARVVRLEAEAAAPPVDQPRLREDFLPNTVEGTFKDVQFYLILNFGHFGALPRL